jgi:hypothetical protein
VDQRLFTAHEKSRLDLLKTHAVSGSAKVRGLGLISLLTAGVPVTMPDDEQIRIGVLRSKQ